MIGEQEFVTREGETLRVIPDETGIVTLGIEGMERTLPTEEVARLAVSLSGHARTWAPEQFEQFEREALEAQEEAATV
jgi:hypothetical protein